MNEEREKILQQISNTELKDLKKTTAKRSKWAVFKEIIIELFLSKFRFIGGILGVTEENIGSYGKSSAHVAHDHHSSAHSSEKIFRDSYRATPHPGTINPVDVANFQAYNRMIDGKGDHDCGHEH